MTLNLSGTVSYSVAGDVATIRFDDGKANVLSHLAIDDLEAALARAERETRAVVLVGRPGKFCAGFDLAEVAKGDAGAQAMLRRGADLWFQLYLLDIPVVAACTGHALAAGAVMLMCTDVRIGENVPAKIGLNEVAIGMALPGFVVELARDRLSKRHLPHIQLATTYDARGARDVGYLDDVVDDGEAEAEATAVATQLASTLHLPSFVATRQRLRGAVHQRCLTTLDADIAAFTVAPHE